MKRIRVLLVDDHASFLRIVAQFLEDHDDIVVVGALDGATEALARLDELAPDLVLMDLAMPGLPGLEAIPRVRAARPETVIIALTGLGTEDYRAAALAAGADEFIAKTSLGRELLPAIRRLARLATGTVEGDAV